MRLMTMIKLMIRGKSHQLMALGNLRGCAPIWGERLWQLTFVNTDTCLENYQSWQDYLFGGYYFILARSRHTYFQAYKWKWGLETCQFDILVSSPWILDLPIEISIYKKKQLVRVCQGFEDYWILNNLKPVCRRTMCGKLSRKIGSVKFLGNCYVSNQ